MCRLVRRLAFYLVIALIVFFAVSLWRGGEKFRWCGEKTGEVIKRGGEKLGEKADDIKKARDKAAARIKKLVGSGREESEDLSEPSKKSVEEAEKNREKKEENKSMGDSLHALWNRIWKKIKALTK